SGIGDSVLVVGDSEMIRVHVHTDDPEAAKGLFEGLGKVENFEQEDMNEQIRDRDERLGAAPRSHIVLLVHDTQVAGLFELDHVTVVAGGSGSISEAIATSPAEEVILVATSATGAEAAASALIASGRKAELLAAENLAVALLALTAADSFEGDLGASVNAERLRGDLLALTAAGIRAATGAEAPDGEFVGVVAGRTVAVGGPEEVVVAVLAEIGSAGFVTAVIDPAGPLSAAALEGRVAELDLSEAAMGDWVCAFAVEA
ncbi:MAG: hypothetical protein WCO96_09975, partial [Actinomycetes bacterium]